MMILKVRSKVKKLLKRARKTIVEDARTPTSVGSESSNGPSARNRSGSIDHHMALNASSMSMKHVDSCLGMNL